MAQSRNKVLAWVGKRKYRFLIPLLIPIILYVLPTTVYRPYCEFDFSNRQEFGPPYSEIYLENLYATLEDTYTPHLTIGENILLPMLFWQDIDCYFSYGCYSHMSNGIESAIGGAGYDYYMYYPDSEPARAHDFRISSTMHLTIDERLRRECAAIKAITTPTDPPLPLPKGFRVRETWKLAVKKSVTVGPDGELGNSPLDSKDID